VTFANASLGNEVREYRETKGRITLVTYYGDDSEHKVLDAFLEQLSKTLKTPKQLKIMIVVDFNFGKPWTAAMGYDTLRFDLKFIDGNCVPAKRDTVVEVVLTENTPVDTSYTPPKRVAVDWSGSCDRTNKDLGLKILYKWFDSDSGSIFFDRIYSLAKYAVKHLEGIKKSQKRIDIEYYGGEWLLSVLTIDTSEIKRIPLQSLGFDPNNFQVEAERTFPIWIVFSIFLLVLILFFVFRKAKS